MSRIYCVEANEDYISADICTENPEQVLIHSSMGRWEDISIYLGRKELADFIDELCILQERIL